MNVPDHGPRHIAKAPAAQPRPPGQVEVFVIHEEPVVKKPDVVEHASTKQNRRAARSEHLGRFFELPDVEGTEAPVAAATVAVEVEPRAVDPPRFVQKN